MKAPQLTISFTTKVRAIKDWLIFSIPETEDLRLPSRGQISVTGTINGHEFSTIVEPDGRAGHWIRITPELLKALNVKSGDTISVELTTSSIWPEPHVPKLLQEALHSAPQKVKDKWSDITPMARWEWVRWMNSTANPGTREIRVKKTISKLNGTHRRPCCFNLAACTDPYVAKGGQLLLES